jgi:galactose mutarotase-like enzyme
VFQIRAFIPGLGEQELTASPSLTVAAQELSGGADDYAGVKSFKFGGAILVPWANRIRGQLTPDGKFIQTDIAGHELTLPADWSGKKPGAEKHAIHGLMLESKFQDLTQPKRDFEPFCGTLDAGNFDGHWPSRTRVKVCVTLQALTVDLAVTAENAGSDILPMGIGWHPYFAFPSGKREQVKLRIPAKMKTVVNNYDDVFPTGEVVPVADTKYDFNSAPRELGNLYLDDCFLDLTWQKSVGRPAAEIIDPAAHYGLRIIARSPEIKSFQVYAPPEKQFVALEPQFNLADPFNKNIWGDRDTGIVMLKPGGSVTYHVTLQLFTPK